MSNLPDTQIRTLLALQLLRTKSFAHIPILSTISNPVSRILSKYVQGLRAFALTPSLDASTEIFLFLFPDGDFYMAHTLISFRPQLLLAYLKLSF